VVHGKGSLYEKMPGDDWQKLANLRAYFGFMWTHPGKKLLFMGCEFAQVREWNHDASPDWDLLDDPRHRGIQHLVRDLNHIYVSEPALHESDCDAAGFRWLIGDDADNSVFAYLRVTPNAPTLIVVCNMTPVARTDYRIGLPDLVGGITQSDTWEEILNTDAAIYGGGNLGNSGQVAMSPHAANGHQQSIALTLPPLSTIVFRKKN
jgi:1,4-alpha-glucan branching enzyme